MCHFQTELPRTTEEFEERLIVKSFFLKSMNAFAPIFYVAFFKGRCACLFPAFFLSCSSAPLLSHLRLSSLLSGLLGARAITFTSLEIIAWRRFVSLLVLVVVCTSMYSKFGSALSQYLLFSLTVCSTRLPHWALHPAQHDHAGKAAHSEQCVWGSHTVRIWVFCLWLKAYFSCLFYKNLTLCHLFSSPTLL